MSKLTQDEIFSRATRRNIDLSTFKVERGSYFSNCNFFNVGEADLSTCTLYRCYPKIGHGAIEVLEIEDEAETKLANLKIENLNFQEDNLEDSNFSNSILVNIDFRHASLKSANFEEAKIRDCYFHEANLENANFRYVEMPNSHAFGDFWSSPTNLKNTDFEGANIRNSTFIKTNFEDANFEKVLAHACEFTDVSMQGANFNFANLEGAKFAHCDLRNTTWEDAIIDNVSFRDSNLIGVDLFGADLVEADIRLTGVDVVNAFTDSRQLQKLGAIYLGPNTQFVNFDISEKRTQNFIEGANLQGSTFSNSRVGAYFIDSSLENVVFKDYIGSPSHIGWGAKNSEFDASFLRSNLKNAVFKNMKSELRGRVNIRAFNSDMRGVRFEDVGPLRLHIEDCKTEGLVLRDLNIESCEFKNLKFKGADFRGTKIGVLYNQNCSFEGALYNSKTKFPEDITDEQLKSMTFVEDED